MSGYPEPLERLLEELRKLPGVGTRSAERIAFYLVKAEAAEAMTLATAIRDVKRDLRTCSECCNFTEAERCPICADPERDRTVVMVVEHPKDLVAFEAMGRYRGLYHVLLGHLSPHEGTGVEHLSVERLLRRLDGGEVREVILATNPHAEGDGTALVLANLLAPRDVHVTRLARGLPSGFTIEYAGTEILGDALEGRRPVGSAGSARAAGGKESR